MASWLQFKTWNQVLERELSRQIESMTDEYLVYSGAGDGADCAGNYGDVKVGMSEGKVIWILRSCGDAFVEFESSAWAG